MVISPRPLSLLVGDATTSLAMTWRTLMLPALLVSVVTNAATVLIFNSTGGAAFLDVAINSPEGLQPLPDEVVAELARPFYIAVVGSALLQVAAAVFIALVSHTIVIARMVGSPLSAREAWGQAARRYGVGLGATFIVLVTVSSLLGIGLLVWLTPALSVGTPNTTSVFVASLLLAALVGPGLWAGVGFSVTTVTVAIEGRGVFGSLRRSMHLVRGRWWATAGFLLVVGLLGGVAITLIQLVATPLAAGGGGSTTLTVAAALGALTQGLLIAAIAAMYTHWYVDLRARKEDLSTSDLG